MISKEEFADGLAFYKDGKEIAFYNKFTQRVRYCEYPCGFGCLELDYGDNLTIMHEIHMYRY